MKLVVAQVIHETNTFSPLPTPWEAFGPKGPYLDGEVVRAYGGTRTGIGGFLDLAAEIGAEVLTPIAAHANPSGPVDPWAFRRIRDAIARAVAAGCDAVMLDLHGAMVVADDDDGEGALLEHLRALAPGLPIAVALDFHTNLTDRMVRNATVMVGYKTYPHVDHHEAAQHAGRLLLRAMRGEVSPVMAWGRRPMLEHTLRQCTEESPGRELGAMARRFEAAGTLAATVFGGFSLADFHDAGPSVLIVADGDRARAERERDAILDAMWESRAGFVYHPTPLADSIARARVLAEGEGTGPVLLVDHGDNCFSGGTCDTMHVLVEALRQGLEDIGVGPIHDPHSVAKMIAAGVGAEVELELGGKWDMPAIARRGEPMPARGRVRAITDGEYVVTGPTQTGVRAHMGRTAVLDTGRAQIVVTERTQEPWDLGVFTSAGIDPRRKRFLLLKSRMYYRPVFGPIARGVVECNGVGVTSSDYSLVQFRKVRRPIYPLDSL
jgi:microcystin degradation protein MlrC